MAKILRLGLAGLGTVGQGVVEILQNHSALIETRTGTRLEIVAVNARSRSKNRDVDISAYAWEDDAVAMAKRDDIDVLVELIGGENGTAKASVEAALKAGKHVVTANKALLAHHGNALAKLAEDAGVSLRYEAAVAGGIPIIKALGEGFAGNEISRISGIMNGTCNYILTRMELEKIAYESVFDEAQKLGYLEADPSLDVGGIDAAHKLSLLAALGFGMGVNFDGVEIEGIENVSLVDIEYASEIGYRVKLVCAAERFEDGVSQSVAPALVKSQSPLGQCMGVTNMVVVEGDALGQAVLQGPGAGRGATASAVLGDLCDIARGLEMPVFGVPVSALQKNAGSRTEHALPYYVRLSLADKVGVLARVAECFAKAEISINEMRQRRHEGEETPVIIITHACRKSALDGALKAVSELEDVMQPPVAIRIEAS